LEEFGGVFTLDADHAKMGQSGYAVEVDGSGFVHG